MEFIAPTATISVGLPHSTHHAHHSHTSGITIPTHIPEAHGSHLHTTHAGNITLWIVFFSFVVSLFGVAALALRVEKKSRVFHVLSTLILTCAAVSYFAMATGSGIEYVPIKNHEHGGGPLFRQVFYARYIDWLFTTPLLLVSLGVLGGLSPYATFLAIICDVFMIITGLLGGLKHAVHGTDEKYKWGWFIMSNVFFVGIFLIMFAGGKAGAAQRAGKTRGLFYLLLILTVALWTAYPIVWALTEGANIISVNAEVIAYAVLDVSAKIGFTFILLLLHGNDEDNYEMPEWFLKARGGSGTAARDGRGSYGAVRSGPE